MTLKYGLKNSIPINKGVINNLIVPKLGKITIIVGDNGCGKTTLLNHIRSESKGSINCIDDVLCNCAEASAIKRVSMFMAEIRESKKQCVLATNNSDVIRCLSSYNIDIYRLGHSVKTLNKGRSLMTYLDIHALSYIYGK